MEEVNDDAYESDSDSAWDSDAEVFYQDDIDAANEIELKSYAKKELGIDLDGPDSDLAWVAWEAFVAPPPEGWTEHVDEAGRVYFHNQVTKDSSWSHPGDGLFRELLMIVCALRMQRPLPSEKQRSRQMQEHLMQMHRRAEQDLQGWSGPYAMEDGREYYYSSVLSESAWQSPHENWERELSFRHAVLHRCLLLDWPQSLEPPASQEETAADIRPLTLCYETLSSRATAEKGPNEDDEVSICSARSFATARTAGSLRSMRTARSGRSLRSTPSPDKRRAAVGASPKASLRSRSADKRLPPAMPPSATPTFSLVEANLLVVPPVLLRAQSESLPRFGVADMDPEPSSQAVTKLASFHEPELQADNRSNTRLTPPASPSPPPCKSSPPCKVPSPVLSLPQAPPCKVGEKIHTSEETYASAMQGAHVPQLIASPLAPKKASARAVTSPCDHAMSPEIIRPRVKSSDGAESPEKTPGVDKVDDKAGSWHGGHWTIQSKRHMEVDNVRNVPSESPVVVDSADIAGGAAVPVGMASDDAAAGDAAVMALIAGKCAPAASVELPLSADSVLNSPNLRKRDSCPAAPDCSPTSSVGTAQFFNIWEDPDNDEAEKVHNWLRKLGLGRYFDQLAGEGFDNMNILAHLEDEGIKGIMEMCPMPMLHEQQLRRGLARLRELAPLVSS